MNATLHTIDEIEEAFSRGEDVWRLETESFVENKFFIGKKDEVLREMFEYYELEELPKNWELVKIGKDDFKKLKAAA